MQRREIKGDHRVRDSGSVSNGPNISLLEVMGSRSVSCSSRYSRRVPQGLQIS